MSVSVGGQLARSTLTFHQRLGLRCEARVIRPELNLFGNRDRFARGILLP